MLASTAPHLPVLFMMLPTAEENEIAISVNVFPRFPHHNTVNYYGAMIPVLNRPSTRMDTDDCIHGGRPWYRRALSGSLKP